MQKETDLIGLFFLDIERKNLSFLPQIHAHIFLKIRLTTKKKHDIIRLKRKFSKLKSNSNPLDKGEYCYEKMEMHRLR